MGVLKGFTIMQRALSSRYNASLLTVMDDKTKEIRQYAYMKSSVDGRKEYYRCNRCLRAKRRSGPGAQASIIVYDGEIIGDKPPEHHADCEPVPYEEIASITSQRESRAYEREENEQVRQVLRNRQLLLKQVILKKKFFFAVTFLSISLYFDFPPYKCLIVRDLYNLLYVFYLNLVNFMLNFV